MAKGEIFKCEKRRNEFEKNENFKKIRDNRTLPMLWAHCFNLGRDIDDFTLYSIDDGPDYGDTVISLFMTHKELIEQLKEKERIDILKEKKIFIFHYFDEKYKIQNDPDFEVFETKKNSYFIKRPTRNFGYSFDFVLDSNDKSEFYKSKLLREFIYTYWFFSRTEFEKEKMNFMRMANEEKKNISIEPMNVKCITNRECVIIIENMKTYKYGFDTYLYREPIGLYEKHVFLNNEEYQKWKKQL